MTRDRTLLGLAMLIYDYIEPGPIPNIVAHGMVGGAGTVVRGAARTPPTPGDAVCRSQIDDLTRNDNGAACDSHFGPLHGFLPPTPRLIQYSNQQPLQVVSSINRDGYPPLLGFEYKGIL